MCKVDWQTLTIGHLSRNKFWGESDHAQYHDVVATTTVLRTGQATILVDPALSVDQMEDLLEKHCGLKREDIDIVYATHIHLDHRVDAECYPNAKLYLSAASLKDVEAAKEQIAAGSGVPSLLAGAIELFEAAPDPLVPGIWLYPLPGHVDGLTGLLFKAEEGTVLVAGDTIMGEEYFLAGEGYWFDTDQEKTWASIQKAQKDADVIVPGHGDWFLTDGRSAGGGPKQQVCQWQCLDLGCPSQESVVSIQRDGEIVLIDPSLPGHMLRMALFDRCGLEPSAVTRVLCLDGRAEHRLDVEVLSRASCQMPQIYLECERSAAQGQDRIRLDRFTAYETEPLPWLELTEDLAGRPLLYFEGPEGRIAVLTGDTERQELEEMGVCVAVYPDRKRTVIIDETRKSR